MKTPAPDPGGPPRLAEAAARRLRLQADAITARLNAVYSRRPAEVDPAMQCAQMESLDKDPW
jgi:hypothetical protein